MKSILIVIGNGKVTIIADEKPISTYSLNVVDDEIYEALISKITLTIDELMRESENSEN